VTEATSVVLPALGVPDWSVTFVVVFLLVGFPVAMVLAWIFGFALIWIRSGGGADWSFLHEPWMATKLIGVFLLTIWHEYLMAERKRVLAGTSVRTSKFWRMTNEVPFVLAILMVLSVTTEWTL
jgi:putative membrane protein